MALLLLVWTFQRLVSIMVFRISAIVGTAEAIVDAIEDYSGLWRGNGEG